jgi:hypothetical protein
MWTAISLGATTAENGTINARQRARRDWTGWGCRRSCRSVLAALYGTCGCIADMDPWRRQVHIFPIVKAAQEQARRHTCCHDYHMSHCIDDSVHAMQAQVFGKKWDAAWSTSTPRSALRLEES